MMETPVEIIDVYRGLASRALHELGRDVRYIVAPSNSAMFDSLELLQPTLDDCLPAIEPGIGEGALYLVDAHSVVVLRPE